VTVSRRRTAGAIGLGLALALALGWTAVVAFEVEAQASSSMLTVVTGSVVTSHAGSEFRRACDGDVIAAGDTIRTGEGAAAEITYFEGSSVRLEAGTEIVVESLSTSRGDALGRAWNVIVRLVGGGSRYEVRTPSSTASVRG
jgi:hypothetical protein